MAERQPSKLHVASSNLVSRSNHAANRHGPFGWFSRAHAAATIVSMESILVAASSPIRMPRYRRLLRDPHVLLGIAIALSATIIEAAESGQALIVALAGVAYVSLQIVARLAHEAFERPVPRLLVALGFLLDPRASSVVPPTPCR